MTSIKIIFNKNNFSGGSYPDFVELAGSFKAEEKINIISNVQNLEFKDRNHLLSFFENIRGRDTNTLKIRFYENKLFEWATANFYQQQAFKSLVLIYHWLELSLSYPKELDLKNNFYNEFIVDWNFTPVSQNTIYLLKDKYIKDSEKLLLLDKLVDLTLLCKIIISTADETVENYFIPLLTPGVPQEYFRSKNDTDGTKAHLLWKSLLKDRDNRIKTWVNNRF